MRAAFLIRPGVIDLREVPVPQPSKGEVTVRVDTALTCGTDLKAFLRGHPLIPMPGLFGHEFSGTVAAVGTGVRVWKEGDGIMAVHSAPCRTCPYCRKRIYNLCERIMATKVLGAFAEYILLPAHIVRQNLFSKPASLSFGEAALLEPLSCIVHGMEDLSLGKGDTALIIGTGPIGLLHLLLVRRRGARVVITGLEEERLSLAGNLGADRAVKPAALEQALREVSGGLGADAVFECTGQPDVWAKTVSHVRRGGTVVLFGGCRPGTTVTYDTGRLHYDELTLKGVFHYTPADVRKAYRLLDEGLNVSALISGSYPLDGLNTAFARLAAGDGVKYAIIP